MFYKIDCIYRQSYINNKYTMPSYETMLKRILDWASTRRAWKFDSSTFQGISEYYDENFVFTIPQELAIKNVYYKWKIDEWYHNNRFKENRICSCE